MGRRLDAALALVALAATAGTAVAVGAPVTPGTVAIGVVGSLLLEGVLTLRADAVRRLWERWPVQVGAVLIVAVGGPVLAFVVGAWVLTALAAGLCTYLLVLAGAAARRS